MREGDRVTLCDGKGTDYSSRILRITKDATYLEVTDVRPSESEMPIRVTLFQALPKGEKVDYVIQKAVECGVFAIDFFESDRSVARIDRTDADRKLARFRRISESASKQSGRGIIPEIGFLSFEEALKKAEKTSSFICHVSEGVLSLQAFAEKNREKKEFSFFVGPEGGFSPEEVAEAAKHGILPVSLGRRVLRSETAPHFILACLAYAFEKF